ncbi:MAG TPA: hypothetical protein VKH40_05595 [Alloacidobacterium sp.]|nr:hypothetical protein [Alloacidobacterium sp.]
MAQFKSRTLVTLVLAVLIAAASAWLAFESAGIYCDRLPSMTICATLAAFAIALSFRQVPKAASTLQKWLLAAAIFIAAATFFADARFVLKYRGLCSQLQEQIRQMHTPAK